MCLIFLSLQAHPTYKLIVAANRDEFYNRKTQAAHYWKDHPQILGGRDLEANGTWMAVSRSGKISMLTNYRDPHNINPKAPSRGKLVSDYLVEDISPDQYLHRVETHGNEYNGFNLITGNQEALWYYSNYQEGVKQISNGQHGLSNHLLDSPWPKVLRGNKKFKSTLEQPIISPESLFEILYDEQMAPDQELPETGLPLERERALSSMFIKTENYGSRCSSVVLIDRNDHVTFSERIYNFKTFAYTTQTFSFDIIKRS
jgi:uncharacterized protein with NRDE domain